MTTPPRPHTTLPAPVIPAHTPPPSDLAASLEELGPGQPRSTDPSIADAALVRSALASMSQGQADFLNKLNVRLEEYGRGVRDLKGEIAAVGKLLTARIDVLEEHVMAKLVTVEREAQTIAHAVNEHTSQIKEVLRFANDTYNMSLSNTRDTVRVRKHLGIPDELDDQAESETPEARPGSDDESA